MATGADPGRRHSHSAKRVCFGAGGPAGRGLGPIELPNYRVTVQMREVAGERLKLGTVGRDEYLQLELRALNDSIAINENSVKVREAQMELNSLLGYDDAAEIEPVLEENLPDSMLQVPDFFLCLQ